MMRLCALALGLLAPTFTTAAIIEQYSFTAAQTGTLPAPLSGSYEPGTDVSVQPLAAFLPSIAVDHPGGDGYAVRVGDLDLDGAGYNWLFSTTAAAQTNVSLSAWVYIDWETVDAPAQQRAYLLLLRSATDPNPQEIPQRQGYIFVIAQDSAWSGISPNPPAKRPFIMKLEDTDHTLLSSYGTADIGTGWHLLKVQAEGSVLRFFVDDMANPVATATDSTYASGFAGIGYYDDNYGGPNPSYAAAYDEVIYETLASDVQDWSLAE